MPCAPACELFVNQYPSKELPLVKVEDLATCHRISSIRFGRLERWGYP
jgi:hypothetical protein